MLSNAISDIREAERVAQEICRKARAAASDATLAAENDGKERRRAADAEAHEIIKRDVADAEAKCAELDAEATAAAEAEADKIRDEARKNLDAAICVIVRGIVG